MSRTEYRIKHLQSLPMMVASLYKIFHLDEKQTNTNLRLMFKSLKLSNSRIIAFLLLNRVVYFRGRLIFALSLNLRILLLKINLKLIFSCKYFP